MTIKCRVCVVGRGLMGSSLARALARNGLRVVAWNRRFERAEASVGDLITPIRNLATAIDTSDLVLACTANYDNLRSVLGSVDTWHGQLLVNLTSGTPAQSAEFARWVAVRDVEYLVGSVLAYPRAVGTTDAYFVYSGSAEAWSRGKDVLDILGTARFVAGPPGLASAHLQGMSAFYISALSSFIEGITYLHPQGLPTEVLIETTDVLLRMLKDAAAEAIRAVETDEHHTDQATIDIFAEGVQLALSSFESEGMQSHVLAATAHSLDLARDVGLGHLGIHAQTRVLRESATRGGYNARPKKGPGS